MMPPSSSLELSLKYLKSSAGRMAMLKKWSLQMGDWATYQYNHLNSHGYTQASQSWGK
jgi:hypothetical protein